MRKMVECKKRGCKSRTKNITYRICSKCHCGKKTRGGICRQDRSSCRHNNPKRSALGQKKTCKKATVKDSEKYSGKKGGKRTGVVYGIVNPKFKGWVKLGYSKDTGAAIEQRYNTNCPDRDFKLIEEEWVFSKTKAEGRLHELAEKKATRRGTPTARSKSEWFKISQKDAKKLIRMVGRKFST